MLVYIAEPSMVYEAFYFGACCVSFLFWSVTAKRYRYGSDLFWYFYICLRFCRANTVKPDAYAYFHWSGLGRYEDWAS